jgi:release factor glutamine methyltransferase
MELITPEEAYSRLQEQLRALYETAEAGNIAEWVIESLCGKRRREWLLQKELLLREPEQMQLRQYTEELLRHRPVQYVLGESYFYDLKLYVDERVLIPRPETEELADWVLKYAKAQRFAAPVMLDIGTGSGCLPLVFKKHLPGAAVYAADISEGALAVAVRNAAQLNLDIHWLQADMLTGLGLEAVPPADIIISNPPYITLQEQDSIMPHVLDFEPHQALFVTNNDPLQFYKAIGHFAGERLKPGGRLFLELHVDFARETRQYYQETGWHTELRKDMQGRNRMLCCNR